MVTSAKMLTAPTPLYASDRCTIYHADCRDILPTLARESIELIATDPPYGVGWTGSAGNFDPIVGDDPRDALDVLSALSLAMPSLRQGRHVYVFGVAPAAAIAALKLTDACELIWDKGRLGLGDVESTWGPQHERIAFGAYRSSKALREQGRSGLAVKLRRGSVLRVPRAAGPGCNRHPTEKPVALMRLLIESSSLPGETVLDPFAGAGATLVAAVLAGRRAIGIEIEERYVELAIERVKVAEQLVEQMERV